jgi:tetratricopeptide (TPR) repeat protein
LHYENSKKQNPKFLAFNFVPGITDHPGFENYENAWPYYRPLTHFCYSLESGIFNNNTFLYQVVSLVFFIGACFSVFLFLFTVTSNRFIASASSLLYLLHPFNGLYVNYKTAYVFSLQTIFLNIIFIYVYRILSKKEALKWDQYSLYLVLYCFTLLFHEMVILFPLILLAYCLLIRPNSLRYYLFILGFMLIACIYYLLLPKLSGISGGVLKLVFTFKLTWFEFCAAYSRIIRWVITKFFFPSHIFIQWTTPALKHLAYQWFFIFVFYLFVFFYFLRFFFIRNKVLALFWLMFGLGFVVSAPASYFTLGSGLFYFEPHWVFYTNIGIFALVGWGIDRTRQFAHWLPMVLIVGLSLYLIFFSYQQNKLYNDPYQYYLQWKEETPGFEFPALGICDMLTQQEKFDEAISCYEPWVESQRKATANGNLAYVYLLKKDYKKSEVFFKKNLETNPKDNRAYLGLALINFEQKEYDKALEYLNRAQMYDVFSLDLIRFKCFIYEAQGKYDQVLRVLHDVDQSYDLKEFTDLYRVRIFLESKRIPLAIELANEVMNRSEDLNLLFLLASTLEEFHQEELAKNVYTKLLKIKNLH